MPVQRHQYKCMTFKMQTGEVLSFHGMIPGTFPSAHPAALMYSRPSSQKGKGHPQDQCRAGSKI